MAAFGKFVLHGSHQGTIICYHPNFTVGKTPSHGHVHRILSPVYKALKRDPNFYAMAKGCLGDDGNCLVINNKGLIIRYRYLRKTTSGCISGTYLCLVWVGDTDDRCFVTYGNMHSGHRPPEAILAYFADIILATIAPTCNRPTHRHLLLPVGGRTWYAPPKDKQRKRNLHHLTAPLVPKKERCRGEQAVYRIAGVGPTNSLEVKTFT